MKPDYKNWVPKAEGYENVRLIDTTDGTFMGKKEASWLGLAGKLLFFRMARWPKKEARQNSLQKKTVFSDA